jgi:hypothetical protein
MQFHGIALTSLQRRNRQPEYLNNTNNDVGFLSASAINTLLSEHVRIYPREKKCSTVTVSC